MHINRRFGGMCVETIDKVKHNAACIVMSKIIFQTTNLGPDFIIDLLSENDTARSPAR